MERIFPQRLSYGDTVGLVTTSHPVPSVVIEKSVEYLKNLGFRVKVGKNAFKNLGYMAGSPQDRVLDLHAMFADDQVSAVFCSGGGRTASHLLPLLDFSLIQRHPKVFVALSNPTIIANAITARTGLITFHGPTGYNFGDEGMLPKTESNLLKAIMIPQPLGNLDLASDIMFQGSKRTVQGYLFGGHLGTNRSLIGTKFTPDWEQTILLIEECFLELHDFDEELTHVRLAGILDQIRGLIVGQPLEVAERSYSTNDTVYDVVIRACAGIDLPIVMGLPFGHTPTKVTLPLGVLTEINPIDKKILILEAGVM